jgi:hypothetical protein
VSVAAAIEPILLVSGIVTAGAIAAFLAPRAVARLLFGIELDSAASLLVTRHWGLLVSLVGCLIAYAAYAPALRYPILIVAVVEKAVLIGLFFVGGVRWTRAMQAVAAIDGLFAILYAAYLAGF